jgi:hypothetical protein
MRAGVALLVALAGCTTSIGTIGVITPDADDVGLKMIRPNASGCSCRASVIGIPLHQGDPDVREALRQVLALDREGNVVANAELRWHRILTGIYNRRCIEVRGDLARTISTVRLPAPPGHERHH